MNHLRANCMLGFLHNIRSLTYIIIFLGIKYYNKYNKNNMQINIPFLKILIVIAPILFLTTLTYDCLNHFKNEETFQRIFLFMSTYQYSLKLRAGGGGRLFCCVLCACAAVTGLHSVGGTSIVSWAPRSHGDKPLEHECSRGHHQHPGNFQK